MVGSVCSAGVAVWLGSRKNFLVKEAGREVSTVLLLIYYSPFCLLLLLSTLALLFLLGALKLERKRGGGLSLCALESMLIVHTAGADSLGPLFSSTTTGLPDPRVPVLCV